MPYFQLKLKDIAEEEVTENSNSFRKQKICKTSELIFLPGFYPTQNVAACLQSGISGSCNMN